MTQRNYLVGGDWIHGFFNDFPETVGNFRIPTDFHIFQRGRLKPPSSYGHGNTCSTSINGSHWIENGGTYVPWSSENLPSFIGGVCVYVFFFLNKQTSKDFFHDIL